MTNASIFLLPVALALVVACGAFQRAQPVEAPEGSYTPARFPVVIDSVSEVIEGAVVTPRFFTASGVQPMLGRFFIEPEYGSDGQGVAVLSHRFWIKRFRSQPGAIGSIVQVDGRARVIVGVAPPVFQTDRAGSLWIPGATQAVEAHD